MTKVTVAIIVGVFLAAAAFAAQLCPSCGAANPDENNFCEACGSPLKAMVTCPQCGEKYPEGTVACGKCGYSFLEPKTVTIVADPPEAAIFVDGVARGAGKAVITLKPGETVYVEARLKGYVTAKARSSYEAVLGGGIILTLARSGRVTERGGAGLAGAGNRSKFAVGVGTGYAQPVGSTGASISGSPKAELNAAYQFNESVAVGVAAGYHFKHADKHFEYASSVFTPVTASFCYLFYGNGIIVFLSAAGGYYFWEYDNRVSGGDPGLVTGAGVRFPLGGFYLDCGTKFDFIISSNDYGMMVEASVSAGYYLF